MTLELDTFIPDERPVRWAQLMGPSMQLAQAVADTDFVPRSMRGNPGAIAACFLYGDELGIGPMEALQSIDNIEGRITLSAALIRGLVYKAGHSLLIHESTGTRCVVSGLRKGRPESERVRVEWNLDQARVAGLLNKAVWQRYPRHMLMARASSELGNQVFPDVLKGLGAIPDDLATVTEVDGWEQTPDQAPARKRVARKRAPAKKELPAPEAVEPTPPSEDQELPPELLDPFKVKQPEPAQEAPVVPQPRQGEQEPSPWPPMPPEPKQSATEKPLGAGARKAMMAAFTGAGIHPTDQRELRLAVTSSIVGRAITTSTELTHSEGLKVIGALAEVETGAAAIVADADGAPKLISTQQEPPDESP